MITFDSKGNLPSGKPIEINLEDLEQHFVFNLHRRQQFEQYLQYLDELKLIVTTPFEQWVDGSFATLKEKPNDIDVVSFVPFDIYLKVEKQLAQLKKTFSPILDLYHVCDYSENHRNFVHTQYDRIEWLHLFSRIRGQKLNKGFIKIYF
jgi:hypothetical protein